MFEPTISGFNLLYTVPALDRAATRVGKFISYYKVLGPLRDLKNEKLWPERSPCEVSISKFANFTVLLSGLSKTNWRHSLVFTEMREEYKTLLGLVTAHLSVGDRDQAYYRTRFLVSAWLRF
jgi:hypothetical protein